MNRILATAATATILATGAACTQTESQPSSDVNWSDLQGNASALEQQVNNEFAMHGVQADAGALSLDELSEIMLVFNDESMTTDGRRQQVERILAGAADD